MRRVFALQAGFFCVHSRSNASNNKSPSMEYHPHPRYHFPHMAIPVSRATPCSHHNLYDSRSYVGRTIRPCLPSGFYMPICILPLRAQSSTLSAERRPNLVLPISQAVRNVSSSCHVSSRYWHPLVGCTETPFICSFYQQSQKGSGI